MQKRAPTLANLLVIVLFILSCFGLLMFLWESFGGPLPLKPKGYRFSVSFPRTLALAEQSDVRISGVEVGHVISLHLGSDGRTHATLELASQYAPIRADTHAILRQKTLLGETYVQLIPQAQTGAWLGDGAQLPVSQVEPSVTLDDILSLFDAKTRKDFQIWQQAVSEGINGRGEQVNAGFAELEPFVEHANQLLSILASQEGALHNIVHYTGTVFNALASRNRQLEGLIVHGEQTFHAAAQGSQAFAEAFKALPAFERNSRTALKEIDKLSKVANPYFDEFRPTERQLSALLDAAKPFAPEFNKFLTAVGPLTKAARTGLPDVKTTLNLTVPVLENLRPVLHNLDPFLQYTGEYVPEVQSFFANLTAASEAQGSNGSLSGREGPKEHLLTTEAVLSPESLATYATRPGTDRGNPYDHPSAFRELTTGLPVFNGSTCADSAPSVNGPANETISTSILRQLYHFKVANRPAKLAGFSSAEEKEIEEETPLASGNQVAAPACRQQAPFTSGGETSQFPKVVYKGG